MRTPLLPHRPLYLMFVMEGTCCCVFPTVRAAFEDKKIFQILAKNAINTIKWNFNCCLATTKAKTSTSSFWNCYLKNRAPGGQQVIMW